MLQEPENYNDQKIIIPQKKKNEDAYDTFTIKLGTQIFRGDHDAKKLPSTEVPAFFTDVISATIYTRGNPDKLSGYTVIKQPTLFHLSYANLITLFDEDKRITEEERSALNIYVQVSEKAPPYIIPVFFMKPENAKTEHKLYLNRRILNIICRLGYDGWVALPETLLQRNMDAAHYKTTGEVRYKLNHYNPEIAICNWANFLEPMK
jgi:hypothetical protein